MSLAASIHQGRGFTLSFHLVPDRAQRERIRASVATALFHVGSRLTDPLCKAQEFKRRFDVIDHLQMLHVPPYIEKAYLITGMALFGVLGLPAAGLGALFRYLAIKIQTQPFIAKHSQASDKIFHEEFTLFSWNICCVGGGYAISDGGVIPWRFRINEIAKTISEQNADIVCLCETLDTESAFILWEKLKADYPHAYFNAGARAIGPSSGLMILSKFHVENIEFTPFPKETLVGRTKKSTKGFFNFDLSSNGRAFANITSTHMQHSEIVSDSLECELKGREAQMDMILEKVDRIQGRFIIITGDHNGEEFDDAEWLSSHNLSKGTVIGGKSWPGDEFCAKLVKKTPDGREKKPSYNLNLDHTFVRGEGVTIETRVVKTGFDPARYRKEATSDHYGLLTKVRFET